LGPRLLPIMYAVKDTAVFCVVLLTFLLGFTHVYYVIGPGDVTNFSPLPLYTAFFRTYNFGVLNQFDIGALEGADGTSSEDYVLIQIFFFLVTVCVNIVLMQLLIGVLNTSYDTYMDQREELFIRERANMILDFREAPLFRLRKFIGQKLKGSRLLRHVSCLQKHDDSAERILFVLRRAEPTRAEAVAALNEDSIQDIQDRITESVASSMNERFEKLEQMLERLSASSAPLPPSDAPPIPLPLDPKQTQMHANSGSTKSSVPKLLPIKP